MSSMNRVFLMGNLTRNPEARKTSNGLQVADLGLAVSEKYRNKDGETVESVCFVDITVWGKLAEHCSHYLEKGKPILVEGRLQFDQWKTDQGENRNRLRVRADRVEFLGQRPDPGNEEGKPSGGPASKPPSATGRPAGNGGRRSF